MATNNPAFVASTARLIKVLGVGITVQRGADAPVNVTAIIEDGVAQVGQHGHVISRMTKVIFLRSQWLPARGDLVTIDGVTRKLEAIDTDDGMAVEAVLHG
jgi:hypothetical protein